MNPGVNASVCIAGDAEDKKLSYIKRIWQDIMSMRHIFKAFLIPAVIMILIYAAIGVWPMSKNSVLVLDLNGQYVYFFEAIRDFFRGEQGILYSFERALGGEFLGIVAYYLASPFSIITALFPEGMITESLYVMFILKCGLSGFNMCVYLHKSHPTTQTGEVIFSTIYALTSYAVVMQHNTMWMDCLLFFPLIMLGVESVIKYGRYKLYTLVLATALFSNYYIGYMVCIGVAVYFFFYYFMSSEEERNPMGERLHFPKTLGRMVLFSLVAVGMAMIIVLPAYYSLTFGKTTFSDPSFEFKQKFDFLDLLSKMYPASYDTVRPAGLPFVYSGMLTFILVPVFFFVKEIPTRKKVGYGLLALFYVLSFNSTTIDLIWHGFQKPNWLNYRYSFMLCFVLIVMAYLTFEHITRLDYKIVMSAAAAILILVLVLQKLEYEHISDLLCVWLSIGCIIGYMILLSGCNKGWLDGAVPSILCVFVVLELFGNGLASVVALDEDVSYSTRTSYRTFIDKWTPVADWVEENDDSFYRAEKTVYRKKNDNFALNLRGLSNSTSTLNANQIMFLKRMGYASKSHWSMYLGGNPVSDSILGVKYLLAKNTDQLNAIWGEPVYKDEINDTLVYKNEYALSLGCAVSEDVLSLDLDEYRSPFDFLNALVTAMLGEDETVKLFVPYKGVETNTENLDLAYVSEHKKYEKVNTGHTGKITFSFIAENDYEIFAYFPSDYLREVKLSMNGEELSKYFTNETYHILSLGQHSKDELLILSMSLEEDKVYIGDVGEFFYYLDEEVFKDVMPRLMSGEYNIDDWTDTHFKGSITAENDGLFFLTVPYDDGWKVYVDGEPCETFMVLEALTAVNLTAGEHTVELKYLPWCVKLGIGINAISVIAFGAMVIVEQYKKKRVFVR